MDPWVQTKLKQQVQQSLRKRPHTVHTAHESPPRAMPEGTTTNGSSKLPLGKPALIAVLPALAFKDHKGSSSSLSPREATLGEGEGPYTPTPTHTHTPGGDSAAGLRRRARGGSGGGGGGDEKAREERGARDWGVNSWGVSPLNPKPQGAARLVVSLVYLLYKAPSILLYTDF